MSDPIPNPKYEKLVAEGKGWDPFSHMTDAYKRITVGPPPKQCAICGSYDIDKLHHPATFALPECDYLYCNDCGNSADPQ